MKKLILLFVLYCITGTFAQSGIGNVSSRIELAFNSKNFESIEDLWDFSITLRLEDSLYRDISSIHADLLLREYFSKKDSVEFRFNRGEVSFITNEKRESFNVDIYLIFRKGQVGISMLNISNYPSSNVLFI